MACAVTRRLTMSSTQLCRQPLLCAPRRCSLAARAMRPIAGCRSLPTVAHLERCRLNWDSIAVLTLHAKILTRIQGASTAKLRTSEFFLREALPVLPGQAQIVCELRARDCGLFATERKRPEVRRRRSGNLMEFASDNAAGVAPAIMDALARANDGSRDRLWGRRPHAAARTTLLRTVRARRRGVPGHDGHGR